MELSDWLGLAGALFTILGGAWGLLIQPKHAQISRLWDEVRKREKEIADLEIKFTREYVTSNALAKVEARFENMFLELSRKIDNIHDLLLKWGKDG